MGFTQIRDVVIVGGGTAGWMTAAALSALLPAHYRYTLVESDQIGTIGVGEASIPYLRDFNNALGIDEDDFLPRTGGTFKLGIEFVDWAAIGHSYFHGFGKIGQDTPRAAFHHYWLKLAQQGEAPPLEQLSLNALAAREGKFLRPQADMAGSPLADVNYAFQFDAGLYAQYLRELAEARGVRRVEGRIVDVSLRAGDGFIDTLRMENGTAIAGDLFIDCSGLAALLIGKSLGTGFDDWSRWLPCDRAIAVPSASCGPTAPYTRASARSAGWQWRIPLQHRVGNGYVYASAFIDAAGAEAELLGRLDGAPLAAPRHLRFAPGRRRQAWSRNCVAIGLAAGFLEPLESTSIHLVQTALRRLVEFFPDGQFCQPDMDAFNRQTASEYDEIRDFLVLHYKATSRSDTPFWDYCRTMDVPATLADRIALFESRGRIVTTSEDLFGDTNWLQVMAGQGLRPRGYHPAVDQRSTQDIARFIGNIEQVVGKCTGVMPLHDDFIAAHCAAHLR